MTCVGVGSGCDAWAGADCACGGEADWACGGCGVADLGWLGADSGPGGADWDWPGADCRPAPALAPDPPGQSEA